MLSINELLHRPFRRLELNENFNPGKIVNKLQKELYFLKSYNKIPGNSRINSNLIDNFFQKKFYELISPFKNNNIKNIPKKLKKPKDFQDDIEKCCKLYYKYLNVIIQKKVDYQTENTNLTPLQVKSYLFTYYKHHAKSLLVKIRLINNDINEIMRQNPNSEYSDYTGVLDNIDILHYNIESINYVLTKNKIVASNINNIPFLNEKVEFISVAPNIEEFLAESACEKTFSFFDILFSFFMSII